MTLCSPKAIAAFLLLATSATPASLAHDITVYPVRTENFTRLEIFLGDPGEYVKIDPLRIVELREIAPDGTSHDLMDRLTSNDDTPFEVVIRDIQNHVQRNGTSLLSIVYDNGFGLYDLDGKPHRTSLDQWGRQAKDSKRLIKYGKTLIRFGPEGGPFDRVLGHRVEFVPLQDPAEIAIGDNLSVRLLIDGNPKPNHEIHLGDDTRVKVGDDTFTDENGIITFPLTRRGYYRLAADYRAPSEYPELSAVVELTGSLVFER